MQSLEIKKFNFGREFQVRVLALMKKRFDFLVSAADIIRPEYFESDALSWCFRTTVGFYQDYGTCVERRVLENELAKAVAAGRVKERDEGEVDALIAEIDDTDVGDGDPYTVGEVVRFCRRQEVRRALLEVAPKTEQEDDKVWDQIVERIEKACQTGAHSLELGTDYFGELAQRLRDRAMEEEHLIIPVGIPDVDALMGGGLKGGQLGVWMGGTGKGKSVALPQCGISAIRHKYKVVHYTLELGEVDIAERYDAAMTGVNIYDLKQQEQVVKEKLGKIRQMYGDTLIIKEYPTKHATVDTLRTHLQALRSTLNFLPDLVVVDYGDLLRSTSTFKDEHAALGAIFEELRGLAMELKIPIWTATQVNRTGNSQEVVDLESVGDSFKKVQVADVVIAIGGTNEDMQEGIARLHFAKNRNGPPKRVVPIKTAYERMCFFNPFVKVEERQRAAPIDDATKAPGMPRRSARAS